MLKPLVGSACLVACAFLATSCSVSDAEPQPSIHAAETDPSAQTSHPTATETDPKIDFGGWSMPEPGPFDLESYLDNPFKPCEDIPEDVLAQGGWQKHTNNVSQLTPYPCELKPIDKSLDGGLITVNSWQGGISELAAVSDQTIETPSGSPVPELKILKSSDASKRVCEAAIETRRGTVSITYTFGLLDYSHSSECDYPREHLERLYQEKR